MTPDEFRRLEHHLEARQRAARDHFARLTREEARTWALAYLQRDLEHYGTAVRIITREHSSCSFWREPGRTLERGRIIIHGRTPPHVFQAADLLAELADKQLNLFAATLRSVVELQWVDDGVLERPCDTCGVGPFEHCRQADGGLMSPHLSREHAALTLTEARRLDALVGAELPQTANPKEESLR